MLLLVLSKCCVGAIRAPQQSFYHLVASNAFHDVSKGAEHQHVPTGEPKHVSFRDLSAEISASTERRNTRSSTPSAIISEAASACAVATPSSNLLESKTCKSSEPAQHCFMHNSPLEVINVSSKGLPYMLLRSGTSIKVKYF